MDWLRLYTYTIIYTNSKPREIVTLDIDRCDCLYRLRFKYKEDSQYQAEIRSVSTFKLMHPIHNSIRFHVCQGLGRAADLRYYMLSLVH